MLSTTPPRPLRFIAATVLAVSVSLPLARRADAQQQEDTSYARTHYNKAEYMVPMRDGVKLYTIVYTPKDTTAAVPIMLLRTPYGIPPYALTDYKRVLGPSPEFDRDGYIFVVSGRPREIPLRRHVPGDESRTSP